MTIESAIDLVQEKQMKLVNFISEINAHHNEKYDALDKAILLHERKIIEMWKQDLDEILEELWEEE